MELKTAPIEQSDIPMSFPSAVEELLEGKKITKQEWGNKEYYGLLRTGKLVLHKPDGKFYDWILSDSDLLGEDYFVVE